MILLNEPEIRDGTRNYWDAQTAFAGVPDTARRKISADICWYDTATDEHTGSFALVQADSELEDLVGEVVRVTHRRKQVNVYVIGGTQLPHQCNFAIARRPWLAIADLARDVIRARLEVVLHG